MKCYFEHNNINVTNIERSVEFYEQALGLSVERRIEPEDGSFKIVFLGDGVTSHMLELTWLRDHEGEYDKGENESHMAMRVDNFDEAHKRHSEMGCVCYENPAMGIYFIHDPDDYWTEILPAKN